MKARLELAAKSKMDLGEVAPVAAAATAEGAAAPAAGTEAAAPVAETKEAEADKAKK